ncbi:MAG: hypothetical protein Q7S67_01150, partial [Telluria sp.]|nr:hypothetical protein [Telluria sp.]
MITLTSVEMNTWIAANSNGLAGKIVASLDSAGHLVLTTTTTGSSAQVAVVSGGTGNRQSTLFNNTTTATGSDEYYSYSATTTDVPTVLTKLKTAIDLSTQYVTTIDATSATLTVVSNTAT